MIKRLTNTTSWQQAGVFILFCLLIYFPVFLHLDVLPIVVYDESLFSIRALHYYQFGDYMENFDVYEGLLSHRNTKLPFTTFLQVLGLKVFGINELGIRLPIALLFVGTVFYTCYFAMKRLDDIYIGYIFGIVLVSSTGFVDYHMLRTGDHDVPFACYLFLALLFFYRYERSYSWRPLAAFTFFMIAALMTKNVLAGIILPGLIGYVLYKRSFQKTIRDVKVYLYLFFIVGIYVGSIFWFEYHYPGFWERMWNYELMGRYTQTIEEHEGEFLYYFSELFKHWQNPFAYLLPIGLASTFDQKMESKIRDLIVLMIFAFLSYSLILSFSDTKTFWYAAPLFLMSAFVGALTVHHFWHRYVLRKSKALRIALVVAALLITAIPYTENIRSVYFPEPVFEDDKYGNFIETVRHWHPDLRQFTLIDNNFGTSAYFYKEKFNALDEGYEIDYQRSLNFQENQVIITCLNKVYRPIQDQYHYDLLHEEDDCWLIRIIGEK